MLKLPLFTPGPWHVSSIIKHNKLKNIIYDKQGYNIADANGYYKRSEKETSANAKLIAKSPDLYECLESLVDFYLSKSGEADLHRELINNSIKVLDSIIE